MSSRKQAISRIVADEIVKETRRQSRRYETDMEPVYIALYENQLAEQRLTELLAGMASATPRPAGPRLLPSPYSPSMEEDVKDKTCIIKYIADSTTTVTQSKQHNDIVDAILEMMETSRIRGEETWPVFIENNWVENTPPITSWRHLCELSNNHNLTIVHVPETQLPAIYTQARSRYGGQNDVITLHLPIDENNNFSTAIQYLTDGRNGICEDIQSDLEKILKVRPKTANGTLYIPKLSEKSTEFLSLTCPVPKSTKDIYVWFQAETTPDIDVRFKTITLNKNDIVFDGTIRDLVYQVMKINPNFKLGKYNCILYKPSETLFSFLSLDLQFENISVDNLVIETKLYGEMPSEYQRIADELLFAKYSRKTSTETAVILACKPAIFTFTQWVTLLQKEGVQIDAKNAVSTLKAQCKEGKHETFTEELKKEYRNTYNQIYTFVENDMQQYLKATSTSTAYDKTFLGNLKSIFGTNTEEEIITFLQKAVQKRKAKKDGITKITSIKALFHEYVSAIKTNKAQCAETLTKLQELKEYVQDVYSEYNLIADKELGGKTVIRTETLDTLIKKLARNCYESGDFTGNAERRNINNLLKKGLADDFQKNDCTPTDTFTASSPSDNMSNIIQCMKQNLQLRTDSKTVKLIEQQYELMNSTSDVNLRFAKYVNLKHWLQGIKELRKVTVKEHEKDYIEKTSEAEIILSRQKILKIEQLYKAATKNGASTPINVNMTTWIETLLPFISDETAKLKFETEANIVLEFNSMDQTDEVPSALTRTIAASRNLLWNFGSALASFSRHVV